MGCAIAGDGFAVAAAERVRVRAALLDPACLLLVIPGAHSVDQLGEGRFGARLRFGVGPFRSVYAVELVVVASADPFDFTISGSSAGGLGTGRATGWVRLEPRPGARTAITWRYDGEIGGIVSLAGRRLLAATAELFCSRFFERVVRDVAGSAPPRRRVDRAA